MLSQYTWWDFAKVVGITLIAYYIYVLWTYYREDIREWISNRCSKPAPQTPVEEEEDSSALYSVRQYADSSLEQLPPTTVLESPAPMATDLAGLLVDQEQEFSMPLIGELQRPAEQSLSQLLSTAKRIQPGEQGVVVASDPGDKEAERLATVINNQQDHWQAFKGISFTR